MELTTARQRGGARGIPSPLPSARSSRPKSGRLSLSHSAAPSELDALFYTTTQGSADTVPKVIHRRGGRADPKPSSSPVSAVNNFAASATKVVHKPPSKQNSSGRKAPRPARSGSAYPARVQRRIPAGSRAPVQRSERTTSLEGPCISSTSDRLLPAPPQLGRNSKMSSWEEVNYYAGLDWANDHHDVIIVDRAGRIVADFQIEHTQQG